MDLDLKNISISFRDRLNEFERLSNEKDIDPEIMAERSLELIQNAKKEIEERKNSEAIAWYGFCLCTGAEGFPIQIKTGLKYQVA